jgi:ammonia channel protein AmtB
MPSFAIIGGILLNVGAYLTYRGKIFEAVWAYLAADMCWIAMAWQRDDRWGMLFIAVGILFGLLAFRRMHRGDMEKSLNRDDRG